MIPQIDEINFGPGTQNAYATLSNATATFAEMGDRYISTQVKIDGDEVPNFDNWELRFRGERFVLDIKDPQAAKDNSSRNSVIDLTFYSWVILQLKRFFMFETTTTATGTIMADKYKASVSLNVNNFCALLNRVLDYYFHGNIIVDLNNGRQYSSDVSVVEMDYTYIWDVLQSFYKIYGLRWHIEHLEQGDTYAIKIGYDSPDIDDHLFEYGFEGGLLRFERQLQDPDIKNILLGRGGTQNVPYRYFKNIDPQNPDWAADPDAIPELANVYFERIYDSNFRSYVQGWRTNPNGVLGAVDPYDSARAAIDWAYEKGHTDTSFDPVEYVKDDASIAKYGEKWGHLEDNDDIYPTIQGIMRNGGRIDTVIAVSEIVTDNIEQTAKANAEIIDINGVMTQVDDIPSGTGIIKTIQGTEFTVPSGYVVDVMNNGWFVTCNAPRAEQIRLSVDTSRCEVLIFDKTTGQPTALQGLTAGTYTYTLRVTIDNLNRSGSTDVTYGLNGLYLMRTNGASGDEWKPTFDIYVRNIFESEQQAGETDEDYSLRVWQQVLGDHLGNEATIVFSDGFMSISEDYEFKIASFPVVDRSKTLGGFTSEWRISLYKSDAEFDATGLFIPNAKTGGSPVAGDHFFFIGIDMPHFYVTEAEKRVHDYKVEALAGTSNINPTWVISLDKVRMDQEYNEAQERLFDKIDAGVAVHIRDPRFTLGRTLDLFIETATFTWSENTIILPDVEVVLTDEIRVVESPVQTIQNDLNVVKSSLAALGSVEQVAKVVTRPMFLAKTGEEQTSLSPTKFASLLTSEDFQQGGMGGQGWGLYRDNSPEYQSEHLDADVAPQTRGESDTPVLRAGESETPTSTTGTAARSAGLAVLELDKLIVRKEMQVNNLVVNQIAYVGGKQIISAAAIECVQVVETDDGYDCYFDQKQGSVKNLFKVNDIALGQVFTPENVQLRFYKRLVTKVGLDYIRLSKTDAYGSGVPEKGDVIVQFGNTTDKTRQYAIIRDVIGGGYEQMLSDLDTIYNSGVEYYFAGISAGIDGEHIPLMENGGAQLGTSTSQGLTVLDSARPRFFIGDAESKIEYTAKDRTIRLKGNIVQSPGGVEFPVPCFRSDGPYDPEKWYYYGDMVVHNGASWIHIGKNATMGTEPQTGEIWRIYADKGSSLYRLDLSNDNASINADAEGNILPGAVRPTCTATLFYGSSRVNNAEYSLGVSVTGLSINSSTGVLTFGPTFTFSGLAIEIPVIAVAGDITARATMTVSKAMPGANGEPAVSYWLVLSADKISVNPNDATPAPNPAIITASAWLQIGQQAPRQAVAADGLSIKYKYDSGSYTNYPSGGITPNITKKTLYIELRKGDDVVDGAEAIPILYDGVNGRDGESAVFADIDNEMDGIVVDPEGKIISRADTETNVSMWLGSVRQPLTNIVIGSGVPSYVTVTREMSAGVYTGRITFSITDTTQVLPDRIVIPIEVSCAIGNLDVSRDLTYTLAAIRRGEPGSSYRLVPSVSSVVMDPNQDPVAYSVAAVTCDAVVVYDGEASPATDCVVKYQIEGSQAAKANVPQGGVPTAGLTTAIIFYLYFSDDTGMTVLLDKETVPIVYDGLNGEDGQEGKKGKIMRGITNWTTSGYASSGENYQGKDDPTGEYYDIVVYQDLYYQCIHAQVGTVLAKQTPPDSSPCWTLMNNYENIATKVLVADDALINQLNAARITVKELTTEGGKIEIKGNNVAVKDSNNDITASINSDSLDIGGSGGTGTLSIASSQESTSSTLTATFNLRGSGSSNTVEITKAANAVSLPAVHISATAPFVITKAYARVYLVSGSTEISLSGLNEYTYSNSAPLGFDIAAISATLPTGEWQVMYEISVDGLLDEGQSIRFTMSSSGSIRRTYFGAIDRTDLGGDGFQTVWSAPNGGPLQGFRANGDGAKVIRDNNPYEALGGGALGNLTALKNIVLCEDYPQQGSADTLYLKVTLAQNAQS